MFDKIAVANSIKEELSKNTSSKYYAMRILSQDQAKELVDELKRSHIPYYFSVLRNVSPFPDSNFVVRVSKYPVVYTRNTAKK